LRLESWLGHLHVVEDALAQLGNLLLLARLLLEESWEGSCVELALVGMDWLLDCEHCKLYFI